MPNFELGRTVFDNVLALRKALGSVTRELSRYDLADLISSRHVAKRRINATTVQRWEIDVEPDFESTRIMAELAGVSFEEFALGAPKRGKKADPPTQYFGEPEPPKKTATNKGGRKRTG